MLNARLLIDTLTDLHGPPPASALACVLGNDRAGLLHQIQTEPDVDELLWPAPGAGEPLGLMGLSAMRYNALQWCVLLRRRSCAEVLLRCGANPSRFCGRVTAVGLAGYTHNLPMLRMFRSAGADLRLVLRAEHLGPLQDRAGSTLLHRVAERPPSGQREAEKKRRTCEFLLRHYWKDGGDPWPVTVAGADPLANAVPEVASTLEGLLADRQRRSLERTACCRTARKDSALVL